MYLLCLCIYTYKYTYTQGYCTLALNMRYYKLLIYEYV